MKTDSRLDESFVRYWHMNLTHLALLTWCLSTSFHNRHMFFSPVEILHSSGFRLFFYLGGCPRIGLGGLFFSQTARTPDFSDGKLGFLRFPIKGSRATYQNYWKTGSFALIALSPPQFRPSSRTGENPCELAHKMQNREENTPEPAQLGKPTAETEPSLGKTPPAPWTAETVSRKILIQDKDNVTFSNSIIFCYPFLKRWYFLVLVVVLSLAQFLFGAPQTFFSISAPSKRNTIIFLKTFVVRGREFAVCTVDIFFSPWNFY